MKSIAVFIVLVLGSSLALGQPGKVLNAYAYLQEGNLVGAKAEIDAASEDSKTGNEAKTWYYRGIIYQAIHDKLTVNKDATDYGISSSEAIETAAESFKKAQQLDVSRIDQKDLKNRYLISGEMSFQEGVRQYNARDYEAAARLFERSVDVKADNGQIDSLAIYNVALAWENYGDPDASIKAYAKCVEIGYNAANCQYFMANLMHRSGMYTEAIAAAEEGHRKFPGDSNFLYVIINAYLKLGRSEDALAAVDRALKVTPNNAHLYFTKGTLLESTNPAGAVANYEKALEIEPDNREALYNLGAYYFNLGADEINAVDAPENAGIEHMKKALPYLQQLHDQIPNEPTVKQFLDQAKAVLEN